MSTPNMLLSLPTVTVTIGPDWATQLNAALEVIDLHDHSSDKGVKITPAGLNINTDLNVNNNIFYNFKAIKLQNQDTALTGSSNANSIYTVAGNLYYTNGSGSSVQLTDGGAPVSVPASASSFEVTLVTSDVVITNSDSFVYLIVDTSTTRSITLPLASGVSAGRIYIIKDQSGNAEANNITVNIQGTDTIDGQSSYVINSNNASITLVGDGAVNWYVS